MSARFALATIVSVLSLATIGHADLKENFKKANLRIVAEGHEFTEGPTLDEGGDILFTSPKQSSIVSHSIDEESNSEFYQGEHPVSALFYRDAKLYATQGTLNRVIEIKSPNEFVTLADSFEGAPFNKPNDLWVSPQGHIYFTDPNYGSPAAPDGEFAYIISKEGEVRKINSKFVRPNGIVGSEDGRMLFITDAGDSKTYRFSLGEDGIPGEAHLFTDIGGDGMTLDSFGNLYIGVPRQKALVAIDPKGKEIARISDFGCTNVCFGPEGKILYITRSPGLWALKIY